MKAAHPCCTWKRLHVAYIISYCVNSYRAVALTNDNKESTHAQFRCIFPNIFSLHLVEYRDAELRLT